MNSPLKPSFVPTWGRYEWSADRVAYIRHCAERLNMTAGDIAAETGIGRENEHIVRGVAQRFGIRFSGRGRKRVRANLCIAPSVQARKVLSDLAKRHGRTERAITVALLEAIAEEGPVFAANLLDLETA